MELDELLAALDLESPADFEYFEHFADLLECDSYIDYDDFYTVLSETSPDTLALLTQNYFDDILTNLPDNIVDIYTLIASIQKCLLGLSGEVDMPEGRRTYVDELYKFRTWYITDGMVICTDLTHDHEMEVSVCEAIAFCRMERLNEGHYTYNFDACMDYDLEEYTVNLRTMAAAAQSYEEEDRADGYEDPFTSNRHRHQEPHPADCDCGCHDEDYPDENEVDEEAYTVGLVDREHPVIDGDFDDEEADLPIAEFLV